MADRTTKVLLGMIALGLWANVTTSLFHPLTAAAQSHGQLDTLVTDVDALRGFVENIAAGDCVNHKLCGH